MGDDARTERRQERSLIEAALDQPSPTPELHAALDSLLTTRQHADRDKSRDAQAEVEA